MDTDGMRVLLAIDGSAPANVAVDLVAGVSWPPGTDIVVAMAVESGADLFGGPWPAVAMIQTERLEAGVVAEAERIVTEARERLLRPSVNVSTAVLRGRPATAIVDRARDMHADMVIVGARGHGTIESMLLGSVSAEVVDHAVAPVLVARSSRLERILLAWDGSACATRAADLLRTLPVLAGSPVRVVSVADVVIPWWTGFSGYHTPETVLAYSDAKDVSRKRHDELVREMVDGLERAGFAAEADRREGDPATEIIAAAEASKADLIVMGTHGRTGLRRLVLGSVARNVLQHATCSVLIARETPVKGRIA